MIAPFLCAGPNPAREYPASRDSAQGSALEVPSEIELVMLAAAGIEPCAAMGTAVLAIKIIPRTHLVPAAAAQHGRLTPFRLRPDLGRVTGQRIMAGPAGVIDPAAFHFYRDHIQRRMPVRATCFGVEIDATNNGPHRSVRRVFLCVVL